MHYALGTVSGGWDVVRDGGENWRCTVSLVQTAKTESTTAIDENSEPSKSQVRVSAEQKRLDGVVICRLTRRAAQERERVNLLPELA